MSKLNPPLHFRASAEELTQKRVEMVMQYVVYCYQKMISDNKIYDFSKKGKLQKEDFLRNGLVDDYLSKKLNREYYKNYISDNTNAEISFAKEENQVYEIDNELADDYIDISVKENKLSALMSNKTEDEIKIAIECKRINVNNDFNEYVKDIEKFTNRPFRTFRLHFEGQIAFVENPDFTHISTEGFINDILKTHPTIYTTQFLKQKPLSKTFEETYTSKHKRNYSNKNDFMIYHLLFNYSNIVKT